MADNLEHAYFGENHSAQPSIIYPKGPAYRHRAKIKTNAVILYRPAYEARVHSYDGANLLKPASYALSQTYTIHGDAQTDHLSLRISMEN